MRLKISGNLVPDLTKEQLKEFSEQVNKNIFQTAKDSIREKVQAEIKEHIYDNIVAGFKAVGNFLYDFSHAFTLVAGGICIIMWVMGWKDGFKYAGIALGINVCIRILCSDF